MISIFRRPLFTAALSSKKGFLHFRHGDFKGPVISGDAELNVLSVKTVIQMWNEYIIRKNQFLAAIGATIQNKVSLKKQIGSAHPKPFCCPDHKFCIVMKPIKINLLSSLKKMVVPHELEIFAT